MANEGSTKPTYSELERRIRELDASETQVMEERDAAENALQEAHIALGGDGEWVGKMPPEYPPDSGDLKLDVPELAAELKSELARVRGLLQRQSEVLQRVASWDFDFYGDCVAEAKKLASDALSQADGE